jgi:hypothetical protein
MAHQITAVTPSASGRGTGEHRQTGEIKADKICRFAAMRSGANPRLADR